MAFDLIRVHPSWSMEKVNEALKKAGHEPIADRSWQHIHKLKAHGMTEYMPINQFDVLLQMDMV